MKNVVFHKNLSYKKKLFLSEWVAPAHVIITLMLLPTPTKTIESGQVRMATRFELQTPLPYLPYELWYRFPEKYAEHISLRSDAFVATALLVAMYTGEDLQIRGAISPKLAYNLFEYRNVFHAWYPNLFQQVNIQYNHLETPPHPKGKTAVATAFSGGVDSFYTLWSHLPENQPIPESRTTHGLFVHGLDLRLNDELNYQAAAEPYSKLFEELGLELIQASTNAHQFSEFRINWTIFHGAPLIGAALCIGSFINRFYIASSLSDYNNLVPYGSTPLIDHLLSTETTHIINHGTNISRSEKTSVLVRWPVTYHKLRVCANKIRMQGLNNCCTCQKCYRMIILFELTKVRHHYNNFGKNMTPISYLHWGMLNNLDPLTARELRKSALISGRVGMALGIHVAIIIDAITGGAIKLLKNFFSRDQLYRLKRVIYQPESNIPKVK